MIELPISIEDIDRLIGDKVEENIHLDYKRSPAMDRNKRHEISKDVSAFANSDGGVLIYGVAEDDKNFPEKIDGGVDHNKCTREQIEQMISSNITPKIDGISISQIRMSDTHSIYCIKVPRSDRGPHQAADKKYYKRFNFNSEPMEDYEINDVRNRRLVVLPLVNISIEIEQTIVFIDVTNIGTLPAIDVVFDFSEPLVWFHKKLPVLLKNGVKHFPPSKTHRFIYNTFGVIMAEENSTPSAFEITVSYYHSQIGQRITETFPIDLTDYLESIDNQSEFYQCSQKLNDRIKELTAEVKKVVSVLEVLRPIAGATGLDFSFSTLRNLQHFSKGEEFDKIDPDGCSYSVFEEVLGVDYRLAQMLSSYFRGHGRNKGLRKLDHITDEVIENLQKHFILTDEDLNPKVEDDLPKEG